MTAAPRTDARAAHASAHASDTHAREAHAREELASALTHGLGAVAALAGASVLVTFAALFGSGWQLASAIVFGASLLLLYIVSTLYHAIPYPDAKLRLRVFDHCAIYLLIAGTYTPFTLVGLRGTLGWVLFGAVWTLAALGIVFKLFFTGRFRGVSTVLYLAMGWLILLAIKPAHALLDHWTLGWLFAGGIAYSIGTVFYHRPMRYSHAIWHVFVIVGSVCHYVAVLAQVLPAQTG